MEFLNLIFPFPETEIRVNSVPFKTSVLPSQKTRRQYNDRPVNSVKGKVVPVHSLAGRRAAGRWGVGTTVFCLNLGSASEGRVNRAAARGANL